ncbi:MAG: tetratricopeptide repeat protein [Candidatus Cyclobacteriaceae bacterium M2_1C_046]
MQNFLLVLFFITALPFFTIAQDAGGSLKKGKELFEKQEYMAAIVSLNQALEADPDNSQAYYLRGRIKEIFFDRHGAMQDYNLAIEKNDSFEDAYFARGNNKYVLQDYYGAISDYSKTIELNPDHVDAYFKRGQAKHKLEAYEDAINDCTKIIALNSKNVDAYYLRGVLRLEFGQMELGCLDLSKAGELGDIKAYEVIREKCNQRLLLDNDGQQDDQ